MKVLLLSRYGPLGASSRIRLYQYLPYLEDHGIHVTMAPLLEDNYVRRLYAGRRSDLSALLRAYIRRIGYLIKGRNFDLLWIEYEILPWLPSLVESLLSLLKIPYVVDYDDAIFHRYDMHQMAIVRTLLGKKIGRVMRRAALVVAGNDYLADWARKAGAKQVAYLPTVVDLTRYSVTPSERDTAFTIGWIGSPVTAQYLHLVSPALSEVCRENNMRVVLLGSGQITLDKTPTEIYSWSEDSEVAHIQGFDVGIMPLPDGPWALGKCGYKLIQYMACGRPVVASCVGVNRQIIEDGVTGFLAAEKMDWVRAFRALRDDNNLRERMGKAGRKKVEVQYCLQITAPRLLSLLQRVAGQSQSS